MPWRTIGRTGVDAGIILITDPCYVVRDEDSPRYFPFGSYSELMDELGRQDQASGATWSRPGATYQITNQHGADIGVVIGHFGGDGVYPVYVEFEDGRIVAAQIRFDGKQP